MKKSDVILLMIFGILSGLAASLAGFYVLGQAELSFWLRFLCSFSFYLPSIACILLSISLYRLYQQKKSDK